MTTTCCGFRGKNWKKLGQKCHLSEAYFWGINIDDKGNFSDIAPNSKKSSASSATIAVHDLYS